MMLASCRPQMISGHMLFRQPALAKCAPERQALVRRSLVERPRLIQSSSTAGNDAPPGGPPPGNPRSRSLSGDSHGDPGKDPSKKGSDEWALVNSGVTFTAMVGALGACSAFVIFVTNSRLGPLEVELRHVADETKDLRKEVVDIGKVVVRLEGKLETLQGKLETRDEKISNSMTAFEALLQSVVANGKKRH